MLQPVDCEIKGEFGRGRNQTGFGSCDRSVVGNRGCWTPRSFWGCVFKQFVPSSESLR